MDNQTQLHSRLRRPAMDLDKIMSDFNEDSKLNTTDLTNDSKDDSTQARPARRITLFKKKLRADLDQSSFFLNYSL